MANGTRKIFIAPAADVHHIDRVQSLQHVDVGVLLRQAQSVGHQLCGMPGLLRIRRAIDGFPDSDDDGDAFLGEIHAWPLTCAFVRQTARASRASACVAPA
ncbi:hypothetical protein D3C87_1875210 [compost metagenome]